MLNAALATSRWLKVLRIRVFFTGISSALNGVFIIETAGGNGQSVFQSEYGKYRTLEEGVFKKTC